MCDLQSTDLQIPDTKPVAHMLSITFRAEPRLVKPQRGSPSGYAQDSDLSSRSEAERGAIAARSANAALRSHG